MVLLIAIAACSGRAGVFICRNILITAELGCIPSLAEDHFLFSLCCAHHVQQLLLLFTSQPQSQAALGTVCAFWTFLGVSEVIVYL